MINISTMNSPVNSKPAPGAGVTVESLLLGNDLPRGERTILLSHALRIRRESILTHPTMTVPTVIAARFQQLVERRMNGEPIAYLVGSREFFGLDLRVTPDVLIPRPDTETLVEAALSRIPEETATRVLDLGTGSGAIAIALARNRPRSHVDGFDVSATAVALAGANARAHGLSNVQFSYADWYSACAESTYDVIVSNPPYIPAADPHLMAGDLRFEPPIALTPGDDGLSAIRLIVAGAGRYLLRGGWLLFEHGYDQADASRALMAEAGFVDIATIRDLSGIERVCEGRIAAPAASGPSGR